MCELCTSDPDALAKARRRNLDVADRLDRLANAYRDLAYGYIKPHTDGAKLVGDVARDVVRTLVEEWV